MTGTGPGADDPGIVLIVEDDPDLGRFLATALSRKLTRRVELVTDAGAALDTLAVEAVDVLVTDIQLPGMSGLEMVGRVRKGNPALPVVMMTAHASVDYAVQALRNQVDEFLVKPVAAANLVATVAALADRGQGARRAARALAGASAHTTGAQLLELETLQSLAEDGGQETSLLRQLDRAAQVQQSLLPSRPPVVPGFDLAALCLPSFAVGGDYFDWSSGPSSLTFTVADVMGKGIPAALLTATVRAVLRSTAANTTLDEWLAAANVALHADLDQTDTFVTLFHGRIDTAQGMLTYVDAGHGLCLVVHPDGGYQRLAGSGLPLGVLADSSWTAQTVRLLPGDTVICFSDGLFDLLGGDAAAVDQVAAIVAAAPSCGEITDTIKALAAAGQPLDDVTVTVARWTERS